MKAFIFPGQGSQSVGMGKEVYDAFAEAREVFQEVDDTLKENLSKLIFEGPIEELTLTQNTQPALMATSMAILRVLEKQGNKKISNMASYVAGHSLGEYTALAAANSLTIKDAAVLLRIRGKAMQEAAPKGEGGMAALIGVDLATAEKITAEAAQGEVCEVANDNSGEQVVISGSINAVKRAEEISKKYNAKRFVLLNVSAPFHSSLIKKAGDAMDVALKETRLHIPDVPLVANVTAAEVKNPDEIKKLLVQQVTGRVRWRESVSYLASKSVTKTVEVGAGKVLSGLVKRIAKDVETVTINSPSDIEEFLKTA